MPSATLTPLDQYYLASVVVHENVQPMGASPSAIAGFTDVAVFKLRIDRVLAQVRNSDRAEGVGLFGKPGEIDAMSASDLTL